jgi:cytochrome c-type biogenesis protein CcmF
MVPGDSMNFEGYTITYESPFQRTPPGSTIVGARLTVTRGGQFVGTVEPSWNFFGEQSGVGTPDVLHSPGGDLYLTLEGLPGSSGEVGVLFDTSPMIWILWFGGLVTMAGGLLAMRARRQERVTIDDRPTVDV